MIRLQLCNYTWPRFVLLCDEGISGVCLFLINLDECDLKTDAAWAEFMDRNGLIPVTFPFYF